MTTAPRKGLCLLALCWVPPPALAQADLKPASAGKFVNFTSPRSTPSGPSDIVHVAPPTGEMVSDRASILAAIERARPGDTIQFAPGKYLVGDIVPVSTPRLTLLGHPEGTTLRGCDPAAYENMEREAARAFQSSDSAGGFAALHRCGMFDLSGGHVTIRNLRGEAQRHTARTGSDARRGLITLEKAKVITSGHRRHLAQVAGGGRRHVGLNGPEPWRLETR